MMIMDRRSLLWSLGFVHQYLAISIAENHNQRPKAKDHRSRLLQRFRFSLAKPLQSRHQTQHNCQANQYVDNVCKYLRVYIPDQFASEVEGQNRLDRIPDQTTANTIHSNFNRGYCKAAAVITTGVKGKGGGNMVARKTVTPAWVSILFFSC